MISRSTATYSRSTFRPVGESATHVVRRPSWVPLRLRTYPASASVATCLESTESLTPRPSRRTANSTSDTAVSIVASLSRAGTGRRWLLLLLVAVGGARGVSGSGQQLFDPGQPLVGLGQRHLASGAFVVRGTASPAGPLSDETGCHLRGDHRQREQPGSHDEARGDPSRRGNRVKVAIVTADRS